MYANLLDDEHNDDASMPTGVTYTDNSNGNDGNGNKDDSNMIPMMTTAHLREVTVNMMMTTVAMMAMMMKQ